jgi:hypothetical protein
MMQDRSVSHVVGYVLTFAVIISSVGLATTLGHDQLQDMRNAEQTTNAERSFLLTAQNLDEIQQTQTVVRRQELDLNQGTLQTTPPGDATLRVNFSNVSDSNDAYTDTVDMRGFEYRVSDSTISYEGGAVFRGDRGEVALQRGPEFLCTDEQALVSIVSIRGAPDRQLGSGTVSLTLRKNTTQLHFPVNRTGQNSTVGRTNVSVEVISDNADGWRQFFEQSDNGWESIGPAGNNKYKCNPGGNGVDSAYLVETRINTTFTR